MKSFDGVFYALSHKWGKPAQVVHKEHSKLNTVTGKQEVVADTWGIKRALLLDIKNFRDVQEQLGANYGGYFDQNKRLLIITKREMPKGKSFNTNDQICINGEYWRVKEHVTLPDTSAFAVQVERVSNGS